MKTVHLVSIAEIDSRSMDSLSYMILNRLKNNNSYEEYASIKVENLNKIITEKLELIEKNYKEQSKEEFTEFYQKFMTNHINKVKKSFDVVIFVEGFISRFYDIIVDYPFDHKLYVGDELFQLKSYYNNMSPNEDDFWDEVYNGNIEIKSTRQLHEYLSDIRYKFEKQSYKIGNPNSVLYYFDKLFVPFIIKAVISRKDGLKYADMKIRDNYEIVLAAVKNYAGSLEYASENRKNDSRIVLEAMKNGKYAYNYVSKRLRDDKEILKASGYESFDNASRRLRDDYDVALEAVKAYRYAYFNVSERLKNDFKITLNAIKSGLIEIEYIPQKFHTNYDILLYYSINNFVYKNNTYYKRHSSEIKNIDFGIVPESYFENKVWKYNWTDTVMDPSEIRYKDLIFNFLKPRVNPAEISVGFQFYDLNILYQKKINYFF
jgi:hypothetical protein